MAKHRKQRNQVQYIVHNVGSSPKTGEWLRASEAPAIPLANYLKAQDNYPATRSKTKLMPTVGSITIPTKHQVSWTRWCWGMILLCILASAEDGTIPDLGHLYNCEVTKYKGLYAIPDPLQCIKSSQLNDIHNFEAQIKQYSPRITRMSVFHCVLSRVNAICSEDNLWKADYKVEYPTVPITHEECWRAWK